MYVPDHFNESRTDEIRRIITHYPLATLVTKGPKGLDANQIPFELVEFEGNCGKLIGHIARANSLWSDVPSGNEVLVVFRAADGYISPNWYPSKQKTHEVVPTWNYQVVNIHGRIRFIAGEKHLRAIVGRLTKTHETTAEGDKAWRMADAPAEFIAERLKQIVGVEITFDRISAKSKLSQNRDEADRDGVAETLKGRNKNALSQAIRDA